MSKENASRIAELLHEAAETHHVVYRITDGDDPDWASWYADWLLDLSELSTLLGTRPVRSHLVHALVQLDRRVLGRERGRAMGGLVRGEARRTPRHLSAVPVAAPPN